MDKVQSGVRAFHVKYGSFYADEPTMPSTEVLLLRARLIIEEAAEFLKAASNKNMTEIADSLGDILYVTYGTAVALGIDLEPVCDEIQRSNMTKDGGGQDSGGKIMKGKNYSPPNIKSCLIQQGWKEDA